MHPSRDLLVRLWQEVGQHLELSTSLPTLAQNLAEFLPLEMLAILETDAAQRQLRSRTTWRADDKPTPSFSLDLVDRRWQLNADTNPASGPMRTWLKAAAPNRDAAMLPLRADGKVLGMLIAAARAGNKFSDRHRSILQSASEPLAAALQNDRRLQELEVLRQQAEAERRSALTRLGRTNLVEDIVGATAGLKPVLERVNLVAVADATVLILGETGSGKEVIARAIHDRSRRAKAPFIRVNCGAIPRDLVDSQLFGHEKGSFTGANEQRQGWFERADGGTLFLDEIGELPLDAQVRLLRVLQEGEFERVGGQKPLHVDVRVIAATHRDLAQLVREGKFREDLWYRVAVFPILLPPLRDRPVDIPELARHFSTRAAARFGLKPAAPSLADINLLLAYPWPGNVRELGSVIERAAILGNGERLDVEHALGFGNPLEAPLAKAEGLAQSLSKPLLSQQIAPPPQTKTTATLPVKSASSDDVNEDLETAMRRHIEAALSRSHGRIDGPFGAARALGVHANTLRSRMLKLGIEWKRFKKKD